MHHTARMYLLLLAIGAAPIGVAAQSEALIDEDASSGFAIGTMEGAGGLPGKTSLLISPHEPYQSLAKSWSMALGYARVDRTTPAESELAGPVVQERLNAVGLSAVWGISDDWSVSMVASLLDYHVEAQDSGFETDGRTSNGLGPLRIAARFWPWQSRDPLTPRLMSTIMRKFNFAVEPHLSTPSLGQELRSVFGDSWRLGLDGLAGFAIAEDTRVRPHLRGGFEYVTQDRRTGEGELYYPFVAGVMFNANGVETSLPSNVGASIDYAHTFGFGPGPDRREWRMGVMAVFQRQSSHWSLSTGIRCRVGDHASNPWGLTASIGFGTKPIGENN